MQSIEDQNQAQGRIGQTYDFDDISEHYIDIANFYELEIMTIKMRYQNKFMPPNVKGYLDDLRGIVKNLWDKAK